MSELCYGMLSEFASAEALLEAVRAARRSGYVKLEAYTPFSVEGLTEALQLPPDRVPLIALLGGIVGGAGGFFLQWYSAVIDYPINSGGRPLDSWPAFIPTTFELAVLAAALATFGSLLVLKRLPQLRHPLFDVAEFDLASRNRFFLCIRSSDPRFSAPHTRQWLEGLGPVRVLSVPAQRATDG